jgi:hypothetical protein
MEDISHLAHAIDTDWQFTSLIKSVTSLVWLISVVYNFFFLNGGLVLLFFWVLLLLLGELCYAILGAWRKRVFWTVDRMTVVAVVVCPEESSVTRALGWAVQQVNGRWRLEGGGEEADGEERDGWCDAAWSNNLKKGKKRRPRDERWLTCVSLQKLKIKYHGLFYKWSTLKQATYNKPLKPRWHCLVLLRLCSLPGIRYRGNSGTKFQLSD